METDAYGCSHYRRKAKLLAPCCGKAFTCRFCHDEAENHTMNRKDVMEVVCLQCETQQKVGATCVSCKVVFGNYFCSECRLFDDEDKNQFHCDGCGLCRVGGRDKFFHCSKCDICLPIRLQELHKCVEKASRSDCPVCLEDLHTSREPSHVLSCGHLLHRVCFEDLLESGNYCCPLCALSMVNMSSVWKHLDGQVESIPMPEEYAKKEVGILCRDCHKESMVLFHVVGLKCAYCGSYNTCRGTDVVTTPPPPTSPPPSEPEEGSQRRPLGRLQSALMYAVVHRGRLQDWRSRSMSSI